MSMWDSISDTVSSFWSGEPDHGVHRGSFMGELGGQEDGMSLAGLNETMALAQAYPEAFLSEPGNNGLNITGSALSADLPSTLPTGDIDPEFQRAFDEARLDHLGQGFFLDEAMKGGGDAAAHEYQDAFNEKYGGSSPLQAE